jgi:hypothetical protein
MWDPGIGLSKMIIISDWGLAGQNPTRSNKVCLPSQLPLMRLSGNDLSAQPTLHVSMRVLLIIAVLKKSQHT